MAKAKRMYGCTECGATFPKWAGQCGACGTWNTLMETLIEERVAEKSGRAGWAGDQAELKPLRKSALKRCHVSRPNPASLIVYLAVV